MTNDTPEIEPLGLGKVQFQEELNKWFESRGIIADLRSHLRHLMITALQNTHIGLKPTDRTSPKAQALNLIVAEYLLRHECHYTLSVLTSEVPTLTNFSNINLKAIRKMNTAESKKRIKTSSFQGQDIEEIFNALGLPSSTEDLERVKISYLKKNNEISLLELILETIVGMSAKIQIRENFDSYPVEDGKRIISKKWSLGLVDILLREKLKSVQITALEEAIFRLTEKELKRIVEEEHRSQMKILAEREKRIQEYLRKHEDEIIQKLTNAEKNLEMRTDMIDEELTERQRHLCELAMEWSNKHEELVKLSKNFYDIECENQNLQKTLKELGKENEKLKEQEGRQKKTMEELKNEITSLMTRLKEVTESNAILSDRIQVLISKENKEVSVSHDQDVQKDLTKPEISLLWSRNQHQNLDDRPEVGGESCKSHTPIIKVNYYDKLGTPDQFKTPKDPLEAEKQVPCLNLSEDDDDLSLLKSTSSEDVLQNVREKLQSLEEESNRINKNYMDYKSKTHIVESDSETSKSVSVESEKVKNSSPVFVLKETRSSQTERTSRLEIIQKSEETIRRNFFLPNLPTAVSTDRLPSVVRREPSKRQLQNREFFLKSRQLVKELEQNLGESITSSTQTSTSSSSEETTSKRAKKKMKQKENLVLLTPLRTASFYCNEDAEDKPAETPKTASSKTFTENTNTIGKIGFDCLALLEETRIKSPKEVKKKPLRQQMLLPNSEEENAKSLKSSKLGTSSPGSTTSGKVSVGKESEGGGFW